MLLIGESVDIWQLNLTIKKILHGVKLINPDETNWNIDKYLIWSKSHIALFM